MPRILTALALALALVPAVSAGAAAAEMRPVFLVYGNWCGPGRDGGAPIDGIDAACMRHDLCYDQRGNFDCSCDLALMDELRYRLWPDEGLYQTARGIYEAIALLPCRGLPGQQATKFEWALNDHLGAVARGREDPRAAVGRLLRLIDQGLDNGYFSRR